MSPMTDDELGIALEEVLAERGRVDPALRERVTARVATLPARVPRRARLLRAAVVGILAVGLGGVAFAVGRLPAGGTPAGASDAPSAHPTSPPTSTDSPIPSATPTPERSAPPPSWAADLVAELGCDGPVADFGAGSDPGGIFGVPLGVTLESAVAAFVQNEVRWYATLPAGGYEVVEATDEWALIAHPYQGHVRAVASFHRDEPEPWTLWQVAACDPVEFDPAVPFGFPIRIWSDEDGSRLPTTTIREADDCYDGTKLTVEGHLFVRDPSGHAYRPEDLLGTYDEDVTLPKDAIPTRFRRDGDVLWLAADQSAVYLERATGTVERWPRVRGDEYSRTDCN